ncbi:MAG: hypothetical protein U1E27_08355, partial [Kiritimatiellia bacterium]|nr:hypothetical protein [Kiritimatiellia bacterium]
MSSNAMRLGWIGVSLAATLSFVETPDAPTRFAGEFLGDGATLRTLRLQGEMAAKARKAGIKPDIGPSFRYWEKATRRVWMLQSRGKHRPMFLGVVTDHGVIVECRVLDYRDSRGTEVTQARFLERLKGLRLDGEALDRQIDG